MEDRKDDAIQKWHETGNAAIASIDDLVVLDDFVKFMASKPLDSEVRINKLADNSKYLGVGTIERLLDELFYGIWEISDYKTEVVANEITGIMTLRVFHPVAKTWLSRVGVGAVQIRCKKGEPPGLGSKFVNALVADYPHLKAECLKNAAKSLGNIFGRNLNRQEDVKYIETLHDKMDIPVELMDELAVEIEVAVNSQQIKTLYDRQKPEHKRNYQFKAMFMDKIRELKAMGNE